MKATLEDAGTTLRLDFESAEALHTFANDWLTKEGCLVQLAEPLKLWTPLTVELRQEAACQLTVEATVLQVFRGGGEGFATALQATETGPLEAFAPDSPSSEEPIVAEPPGAAAADSGGEMLGASPSFRIRQMNVSEKMRLASKASRTERQILLRDGSPQVLMGLLANPRIEDKEVVALAKSSSASSGVLQRIAKDRRWSTSYEIRLALVRNPQTPTPLALRMLETLREKDLRVMAKGANVREAIRAAALRKIVKH
ncbi:MAG: hypothetical protein ACE5EG_08275 [Thermoanaerobaculia bacterium]